MRFYAIKKTDEGVFVQAEATSHWHLHAALAGDDELKSGEEMKDDPQLAEALERWHAQDDLQAAIYEANDWLQGYEDDPQLAAEPDPRDFVLLSRYADDPACAAVLDIVRLQPV